MCSSDDRVESKKRQGRGRFEKLAKQVQEEGKVFVFEGWVCAIECEVGHKVNSELITLHCHGYSSHLNNVYLKDGCCHYGSWYGEITNAPSLLDGAQIEKKIETFLDDPTLKRLELSPTTKLGRHVM